MEEIHHDLRHDKKSGVLFSCLVAFVSFVTQALSMGFFVSFGTVYVELINKFNTTESQAGIFFLYLIIQKKIPCYFGRLLNQFRKIRCRDI